MMVVILIPCVRLSVLAQLHVSHNQIRNHKEVYHIPIGKQDLFAKVCGHINVAWTLQLTRGSSKVVK